MIVLSAFSLSAQRVFTIHALEYPPFLGKNLPGQGITMEIIRAALAAENARAECVFMPVARGTALMKSGEIPVGIFGFQLDGYPHLKPVGLGKTRVNLYTYNKDPLPAWNEARDLIKYRVGSLRGLPSLSKLTDAGVAVDISETPEVLIKKLRLGRIEVAILIDETELHLTTSLYPAERNLFRPMKKTWTEVPYGVVSNIETAEGRAFFDAIGRGMRTIVENGTYLTILEQIYGKGQVPPDMRNLPEL